MSGIFQTDGEKNVGLLVKFEFVHEGETRTIEEALNVDKVDNVSFKGQLLQVSKYWEANYHEIDV